MSFVKRHGPFYLLAILLHIVVLWALQLNFQINKHAVEEKPEPAIKSYLYYAPKPKPEQEPDVADVTLPLETPEPAEPPPQIEASSEPEVAASTPQTVVPLPEPTEPSTPPPLPDVTPQSPAPSAPAPTAPAQTNAQQRAARRSAIDKFFANQENEYLQQQGQANQFSQYASSSLMTPQGNAAPTAQGWDRSYKGWDSADGNKIIKLGPGRCYVVLQDADPFNPEGNTWSNTACPDNEPQFEWKF